MNNPNDQEKELVCIDCGCSAEFVNVDGEHYCEDCAKEKALEIAQSNFDLIRLEEDEIIKEDVKDKE